jgi:hypothetical protein
MESCNLYMNARDVAQCDATILKSDKFTPYRFKNVFLTKKVAMSTFRSL